MAKHIETGKKAEQAAATYLSAKGYGILEQNWRSGHKEIDIIADSGEEILIVEVKARKAIGSERLEEHIPWKKQQYLVRAAGAYLKYRNLDRKLRFDVILLTGESPDFRIEHIEDAFSAWDT